MADKFRPRAGEVGQVKIISDATLNPKSVIIIDDIVDTCGTLGKVVEAVRNFVPNAKIYAVGTHGYFSKDAAQRVAKLVQVGMLEWVAVTNTISQRAPQKKFQEAGIADRLKEIDVSRLIAGAIIRIHLGASANLPKFRLLGPLHPDPLLAEAAFVPTSQYTLKAGAPTGN